MRKIKSSMHKYYKKIECKKKNEGRCEEQRKEEKVILKKEVSPRRTFFSMQILHTFKETRY